MPMEAFTTHGLIGKIVDKIPPKQLHIRYGSTDVQPGMTLTPSMTKSIPLVRFEPEANAFYTLIMNDPDAPSRSDPKFCEFHHWLVVNIPEGDISKGETLTEYIGPMPSKGTGHHRYVFMLYKQPKGRMDFSAEKKLTGRSVDGRKNHKMKEFAKKHNFQDPIFGNFFQSEWDDYVPKVYEQMKM